MKGPLATLALVLALGVDGCDADNVAGPAAAGLELTVEAYRLNHIGSPPTFTRILRNTSDAPITIVFAGCGILPYIATWSGDIVHPVNGHWGCGGNIESLTLAPGQQTTDFDWLVSGAEWSHVRNTITLPPGRYRAFAEVDGYLVSTADRVSRCGHAATRSRFRGEAFTSARRTCRSRSQTDDRLASRHSTHCAVPVSLNVAPGSGTNSHS
jgi:hypothetical protein